MDPAAASASTVCLAVDGDRIDLRVPPLAQSTVIAVRVLHVPRATQYVALHVGARRVAVVWPSAVATATFPLPLHRLATAHAVELRAQGAASGCDFTVALDYRAAAADDPLTISLIRGPQEETAWVHGIIDPERRRFLYTGMSPVPDDAAVAVDTRAPLAPQIFRALTDVRLLQFERYTVPATLLRTLVFENRPDRLYLDIQLGPPPAAADLYELLWIRFEGGARPLAAWNIAPLALEPLDAVFRDNVAAFDRAYARAAPLTLRVEATDMPAVIAVTATPIVVRGAPATLHHDWLTPDQLKAALDAGCE